MRQLWAITSRNLRQYLRDTGAIFFSLLSMIIIILLMVFFLGDTNVDEITYNLSLIPGRDAEADAQNAKLLVLCWTCAGILSINAMTVTLGCLSRMISDRESGKLASLYTAPVSRMTIAAGYILSTWLSAVILCVLTLVLTEICCVWQGLSLFTAAQHGKLLWLIAVNCFAFSSMMYFLSTLVKTEGAWGGLGTVIGTLVGFLGGIYLPIGALSDTIGNLLKGTPVIYSSAMFRKVMTQTIMEETFEGAPVEMIDAYREFMGIDVVIGGKAVTAGQEALILLVCGVIFMLLSALVMRFGKKNDR